jgi:hypothetical protein
MPQLVSAPGTSLQGGHCRGGRAWLVADREQQREPVQPGRVGVPERFVQVVGALRLDG